MRDCLSIYTRYLWFLVVAIAIAGVVTFPAVAQETGGPRRLERVEVVAPERRPATTPAQRSDQSADTNQQQPYDDRPPSQADRTGRGTTQSIVGASTLAEVQGKSEVSLSATSLPSQVSVITAQDIQRLDIRDYSDLFRQVPGIRSLNFNQGDLGNPISMRGFASSSNGNETCVFIDGVPQNFPSLASGTTGTAELYWLAPEAIDRIEVIKGPFSAIYGDFTLAGVINIITKNSQPSPSLTGQGGSYGMGRALGILSDETWIPTPYLVHEYYNLEGYRDNMQYSRWSLFNKGSVPLWGGILSLRYNYYTSTAGAPGYLRVSEVQKGITARTAAVNTTDGGDRLRNDVVMNFRPSCGERGLYVDLYAGKLIRKRWYSFPPSPSAAQADDRSYWGGRAYYNLVFGEVASLTVGGSTRQDSGPSHQFTQTNRRWIGDQFLYDLNLANWAWFLQGQLKLADSLKIIGGVRGDYFTLGVDNKTRPVNSGTGYPHITVPKIGFVITPVKNINAFGNIGSGFRSPGAQEVSPYAATSSKRFDLNPAKLDSADIGVNLLLFDNLYLAADYYHTINTSEIRTVNNQPQNIGSTLRKGYEIEAKFYASSEVNVFANYAWVDARVLDPTYPGQVLLPGIPEHTVKGGIDIQKDFGMGRRVVIDAYYQYISGPPNYNGSSAVVIYSPDYDVYNFKIAYEGRGWSGFVAAKFQPRELSGSYTFISGGYMCFNPQPKWDFMGGLTYTFW